MIKVINKYMNLPNIKFKHRLFTDHWLFWTFLTSILAIAYLKVADNVSGGIFHKRDKFKSVEVRKMDNGNNINSFVDGLDYFEKINLLITLFQAEGRLSRKDAYDESLVKVSEEGFIEYKLKQAIKMGPSA